MRIASTVAFFAIALVVLGAWHWYLWARLVRDPGWPHRTATILTCLVFGLAASMPLGALLGRFLPRPAGSWLASVLFVWFGAAFFLAVLLFLSDLGRWGVRAAMALMNSLGETGPDPDRREILARGVAGAAALGTVALTGVSIKSAMGEVESKDVEVKLDRLPKALSGLTVVQLTDVHVGPTIGRKFVQSIVEKTMALRPDAIVITGDLVDGSVASLRQQAEPLARLRARYGVYFVTGNHEYYSGVDPWLEELRRYGIRPLRNERVVIGDPGASIDLAGVDDTSAWQFGDGHGADYERALGGRDPERELLLLAHQPKAIHEAARYGIGLQLSGHTHGGQIFPFNAMVGLVQPYVAGLYRHDPRTQIYVSRGTGYWGPPMRLFAPAEITRIVLT